MQNWINPSSFEAAQTLQAADVQTDLQPSAGPSRIGDLGDMPFGTVFRHPETDEILDSLEFSETFHDISAQARTIRKIFGLQHLTVTAVTEGPATVFAPRTLTTFSSEWIKEYVENRYQMWDPVFVEPVGGRWAFLDELWTGCPVVSEYLSRAERAGIGPAGLVTWTEVLPGTIIAVTVTSSLPSSAFRRSFRNMEPDLLNIGKELARAFARANKLPEIDPMTLNDQELALMRAVAGGASRQRQLLENPGSSDLARALCRRIGARTLAQAAAVLASSGILSLAPMRTEDFCFAEPNAKKRHPDG